MQVSFVIPVYNGRECIVRCLESICNLGISQQEYEIIVVDDCSTDNTCDVVQEYMRVHPQVKLLYQSQNHRQGAARNLGLKIAKGEYITFVDSDDVILRGVVSALNIARQQSVDLVYCSCYHEKTLTDFVLKEIDMDESTAMSGIEFCERYQQEGVFWYPWGILYRLEWLKTLNYPFIEDRQHEDRDWLAYVMSKARTVTNSKQPMYRYICNPHSTCRMPRYSTVFDHIASGIRHIDLAKQLANQCPKMSATLYAFGREEIHHSIRLRNLTKYLWEDNKQFYDTQHLMPLMADLKRICREYRMPIEVYTAVYLPHLTSFAIWLTSPIANYIRTHKK